MRLLVTGGAGFLGAQFVRYVLGHYDPEAVTCVDALLRPGSEQALAEVSADGASGRYEFVRGDVANSDFVESLLRCHKFYAVVNFASTEAHDPVATSPSNRLRSNIAATGVLLDAAERAGVRKFIQISSDQVYGHRSEGASGEDDPLRPHSRFAGTKAAADMLALSHAARNGDHGMEVNVLRPVNCYGPWQPPHKLVAKAVSGALTGRRIPVVGAGAEVREWLYLEDFCAAAVACLFAVRCPVVLNIAGGGRHSVLEVVRTVLRLTGRPETLVEYLSEDESQDARRAVETSRIEQAVGWRARTNLESGLRATLEWFGQHPAWWSRAS